MADITLNPQLLAQLQAHGMPTPAGTNENGEPYWIIEGRTILWAELQQYLWEIKQQQGRAGGGGIEQLSMPNAIPELWTGNVETQVEKGPELNPERSVEQSGEQKVEQAGETQTNKQKSPTQSSSSAPQKGASLIGDSPKLSLDTSDHEKVRDYVLNHKEGKGDPKYSSTFLSALLGRILRSLFPIEGK